MKLRLVVVAFLLLGFSGLKGQLHLGGGSQLILDSTVFGVQGRIFYEYDDTWRGAGAFTYFFDNIFDWSVDLDAQYKLIEIGDGFNLAPLAGLSIIDSNVSTSIGLNVGVFLDLNLNSQNLYIEPKFIFRDGSAIAVSAGILF